jgi:hypothetical protein
MPVFMKIGNVVALSRYDIPRSGRRLKSALVA